MPGAFLFVLLDERAPIELVAHAVEVPQYGPVKIIFVCTANQARSPIAAAAFARASANEAHTITSAGTLAVSGHPPLADAVTAAAALGLDISQHRSRPLGTADAASADMVITMERAHSAVAVVEAGAPMHSTFTLGEVARLLTEEREADPESASAQELLARLHSRRQRSPRFVAGEDVPDPVGRPLAVHQEVASRINQLCEEIAPQLSDRSAP